MFNYFVSYSIFDEDNKFLGMGNSEVSLSFKLKGIHSIRKVQDYLKEKYKLHGLVILNFQEFN